MRSINKNIIKTEYIVRRAFTMVEIMIAVAVFALLFMMFNEFVFHSRRQAENAFQKSDNLRETRLALQHFEFDVRSSSAITNFEVIDGDATTMTLKHVKEIKSGLDPVTSDTMVYDYITYTFYHKDQTVKSKQIKALTLAKDVADTDPGAGAKASDKILLKSFEDGITANPIGVKKEEDFAIDGVGIVKKESKFFVIDNNYYVNVMLDDAVTPDKKEEMIAKATFKGKYNGSEVGFTDIKNAIAVWLQFIITDNNKNINFFDQLIYLRSKM